MEKLQIGVAVATFIQTFVVVISLLFIWHQVRLQTKLALIANTQTLVSLSSPFNLEIAKDPAMAALWVNGCQDYDAYTLVDKCRYKYLLIWWLNLYENIYFQSKNKLLDAETHKSWEADLKIFIDSQNLGRHWVELKAPLQNRFCKYVEELMKEEPTEVAQLKL